VPIGGFNINQAIDDPKITLPSTTQVMTEFDNLKQQETLNKTRATVKALDTTHHTNKDPYTITHDPMLSCSCNSDCAPSPQMVTARCKKPIKQKIIWHINCTPDKVTKI
jgi:5,10-methylenetetrahydrofolate reductase